MTPTPLRQGLRKTGTGLRLTQALITTTMVVFIGVSAWAAMHGDWVASVLSALLAIACLAAVYFTSIFLRHLPNMHRQLTDYEKRERTLHGENDVN